MSSTAAATSSWWNIEIHEHVIRANSYILRVISRLSKKSRAQVLKESRHSKALSIWRDELLPHWSEDTYIRRSSLFLSLCNLGIPACLRGSVWPLLIGNAQGVRGNQFLSQSSCAGDNTFGVITITSETSTNSSGGDDSGGVAGDAYDVDDLSNDAAAVASVSMQYEYLRHEIVSPAAKDTGGSEAIAGCDNPAAADTIDDANIVMRDSSAREESAAAATDVFMQLSVVIPPRRNECEKRGVEEEDQLTSALEVMEVDIPRTFPTLAFFHNGASEEASLNAVLCSFARYSPDIGYIQGMTYVAAILLLFMEDKMAFQCLVNLVMKTGCKEFFSMEKGYIDRYANCFDLLLSRSLPTLHRHLTAHGVRSAMFLMDWKLTLFGKALSLELAVRIWDRFLLSGEVFFMQCCLALVSYYEPMLVRTDTCGIMKLLLHFPEDLFADDLFDHIERRMVKMRGMQYEEIEEVMTELDLL